MAAIDEAGSIFGTYKIAVEHDCKNAVIIGRNIHTTLLYAASLREAIGPEYKVIAIMDKYFSEDIPREEIEKVMEPLVKETFFVDLSEPIDSYHKVLEQINGDVPIDMTEKQKLMTAKFLYELLAHKEGDIRTQSAILLGRIVGTFNEEYKKELPEGVSLPDKAITNVTLFRQYLAMIIEPDHKLTEQHKKWIENSLNSFVMEICLGS